MNLSPMRFKTFVWPHNPTVYTISYERKMALHKIPFGRFHLQSLGQTRRVFRGEGEFVGADAYDKFKELASLFYSETPGTLVHPVWMTTTAWFVGLELMQEPRSDYVRYSFEFWEVPNPVTGSSSQSGAEGGGWYTVVQGDTLWAIAGRNGMTVDGLLALNPGIRNPNLITVGQKVRLQ